MSTLLLISYLVIDVFGSMPESTASRVLSMLPPVAPLLMPMRLAHRVQEALSLVRS